MENKQKQGREGTYLDASETPSNTLASYWTGFLLLFHRVLLPRDSLAMHGILLQQLKQTVT